jgi:hypothetical protein
MKKRKSNFIEIFFMEQEEKFSNNPEENLRIENELMRIKLKAQYGDAFQMGTSDGLTPEMENQFLKNILEFEASHEKGNSTTVYNRIGKPVYKLAEELTDEEMKMASEKLLALMKKHNIDLGFCHGPYSGETMYRFITEEFFSKEVPKSGGRMISGFIYEEYYPNHKADIERCGHDFLRQFFTRSLSDQSFELSKEIITAEGQQMDREALLKKLQLYFDAFENFTNDGWTVAGTGFELQPENESGMGFTEGMCKYDALLDNKETLHFEGPYKLYMNFQYGMWQVFYFVLPGFKW